MLERADSCWAPWTARLSGGPRLSQHESTRFDSMCMSVSPHALQTATTMKTTVQGSCHGNEGQGGRAHVSALVLHSSSSRPVAQNRP